MRSIGWTLLVAFASVGMAEAAIPNPSYGTPVTGTGFYLQPGGISEATCDPDPTDGGSPTCVADFLITLPTGYANGVGEIYLRNFYLGFDDSTGGQITNAKLMLKRNSYTQSTGVFSWHVEVNLDANPAPANDDFKFGFDFGIVIVDNANFRATQKTAANFAQVFTGNPCDSSDECEDTTVYTAVGTMGAPFQAMLLRGFDVRATSGAGLSLSQLRFDIAGIAPITPTQAGEAAHCTAIASPAEGIQCELGLVAIAFAANHLTDQALTSYITTKLGTYSNPYSANSTSGSAASNFIFGLQTSDHAMASPSSWKNVSSGCGDTFFSSSPGTGSVSGHARHGFVSPTTPSVTYDSYVECFLGFVY